MNLHDMLFPTIEMAVYDWMDINPGFRAGFNIREIKFVGSDIVADGIMLFGPDALSLRSHYRKELDGEFIIGNQQSSLDNFEEVYQATLSCMDESFNMPTPGL